MIKKNGKCLFGASLIVLLLSVAWVTPARAQTTVLSEDWSGGSINGSVWTVSATDTDKVAELEDLGGGDYGFYTMNLTAEGAHAAWIYSVDSFSRGDSMRCTFLAWGDPSKTAYTGVFPAVASVNGPWRQSTGGYAPGEQEACVSLWLNQPLRFSQNEWNTGFALSSEYNAAWQAATSKANAILHRVQLGDTMGASFDWSTDGGSTWNLERDTREASGGIQTDVYIGFATSGSAVFIDDILVQTGPGGLDPPEPTPTPFPDPGPLFSEDWNSGEVNSHFWLVSTQSVDGTGTAELEEVAPGDWAFYTLGPRAGETFGGSDHRTSLYSDWGFDRGEDLRVTFKAWGDPNPLKESWGGVFPSNCGIMGPWHTDNSALIYSNPEAMIRYWGGQEEFSQPGDPWTTGPKLSLSWKNIFYAATEKSKAMTFRVWLGDTLGAKLEWTVDGVNWYTEYDTRGTPSIGESHATAYLGWGTYGSAVFIDDIVVENNLRFVDDPTPTPTGPLLAEDWNTGTIDADLWLTNEQSEDGTGTVALEEIAPGDWAIYTLGPAEGETFGGSDHTTWVYSKNPYFRGDNVRVEFKIWGDPEKAGWGGGFPSNSAIQGPWHTNNTAPIYNNPEAMIRYWGGQEEFAQPGDTWTESPKMSQPWIDAFYLATSKADAMTIRVWLDDSQGAKVEWKVGEQNWTTEYDTRGTAPIDGSNIAAYLGWGTYSSGVFIDDIFVENDARIRVVPNAAENWVLF